MLYINQPYKVLPETRYTDVENTMANISEVAALAGVSVATVSRYFTAPEKVAKKSIAKVEAAIQALDYKPNLLARNFSQSRSYSVLVLVPKITNPFLANVIEGIEAAGRSLGYTVLLGDIGSATEREKEYLDMVDNKLVEGVINFSTSTTGKLSKAPTEYSVSVCDDLDESNYPTIAIEDKKAAVTVVEYLLSLGHKNIGCLLGIPSVNATTKRLAGYRETLEKAGLPFSEALLIQGDFSIQSGVDAARLFANMQPRPTAIFCMNDEMAIGLLQGLKTEGLKIPEDISVVGFDDIEFSKYCDPPLTTIRQPARELGSTAMRVLYELINSKDKKQTLQLRHRLPADLIVRKSTAAAKNP